MNSDDEEYEGKPIEVFPTDEFVKVCEELGLMEPTVNEITEDMWNNGFQKFEDSRW